MTYAVTSRLRVEKYRDFELLLAQTNGRLRSRPIFLGNWVMVHFEFEAEEHVALFENFTKDEPAPALPKLSRMKRLTNWFRGKV